MSCVLSGPFSLRLKVTQTIIEDIVAQRSSTAQLRKLCRGFVQPSWQPWIASDPMSLRILQQQRFQVWPSRCLPPFSRTDWILQILLPSICYFLLNTRRVSLLCQVYVPAYGLWPAAPDWAFCSAIAVGQPVNFPQLAFQVQEKGLVVRCEECHAVFWIQFYCSSPTVISGIGPREIREGSRAVSCRHCVKLALKSVGNQISM